MHNAGYMGDVRQVSGGRAYSTPWSILRERVKRVSVDTPPQFERPADAQAGLKLLKFRRREAFGHHVGELLRRRDVENTQLSESHFLAHEVDVELDVLRASMMNWVGRHVRGGDVVAVHHGGLGQRHAELAEKLTKRAALGDSVGDRTVLCLRTRPGDCGLSFRRPGDE